MVGWKEQGPQRHMFPMCELRFIGKLRGKAWPQYSTVKAWSWSLIMSARVGTNFDLFARKK